MVWFFIILAIVVLIIYNFISDRDKMLKNQVDYQGGMAKKYEYLIDKLTGDGGGRVLKVTRDHIHICNQDLNTATNFFINESFNSVEVEWVANLGPLGTHKHKWSFANNYPQDKMMSEMEQFMEWKAKQMFGNNL
jgi:hypothetical protein